MSNRMAWIAVAVVVIVVGLLVFRSLRTGSPAPEPVASRTAGTSLTDSTPRMPGSTSAATDTTARVARDRHFNSVLEAQKVLKLRGYYDGPMDGNYSPAMAEAIRKFQKANGMQPTGYLNARLYDALGIRMRQRPAR